LIAVARSIKLFSKNKRNQFRLINSKNIFIDKKKPLVENPKNIYHLLQLQPYNTSLYTYSINEFIKFCLVFQFTEN